MTQTMNITHSDFQVDAPIPLPDDEVQLWRVDLEAIRADESRWRQVLSADELTRASRFLSPHDRQRFVASRALLRIVLASYLATEPLRLSFSYSKKEKPSLDPACNNSEITFNVSHSGGIALFAFNRKREPRRRCGADTRRFRPRCHRPPLLLRARAEATRRFASRRKG